MDQRCRPSCDTVAAGEFGDKFGRERVGIVTGDVKRAPDAPVLVMTTECLRNTLFGRPADEAAPLGGGATRLAADEISLVIFDEVQR